MKWVRRLGLQSDEMALAFVLWMCSLPLLALLILPRFGWQPFGLAALILLAVLAAICWGMCGWVAVRGRLPRK